MAVVIPIVVVIVLMCVAVAVYCYCARNKNSTSYKLSTDGSLMASDYAASSSAPTAVVNPGVMFNNPTHVELDHDDDGESMV